MLTKSIINYWWKVMVLLY